MPDLDISQSILRASQGEAAVLMGHYVLKNYGRVVKASDGSIWYSLGRLGDCVVLSPSDQKRTLGIKILESVDEEIFHVETFEWPLGVALPLMEFAEFVMSTPSTVTYYCLERSQREKIWKMETAYWEDFTEGPTYVNFYEGVSVPLLRKAESGFPHLISRVMKSILPVGELEASFAPEHFAKIVPLLRRQIDGLSNVVVKPRSEGNGGMEVCILTRSKVVPGMGTVHVSLVRGFDFALEGKGMPKEICQLSRLNAIVEF
jgi:hypothetical protein